MIADDRSAIVSFLMQLAKKKTISYLKKRKFNQALLPLTRFCSFSIGAALLFFSASMPAQTGQAAPRILSAGAVAIAALPDAPMPQSSSRGAPSHQSPRTSPLPYANFNWRTIPPEYQAIPLTASGKMKFVLHEMTRPVDLVPALISAGVGIYDNSDPKYGTGAEGFGQRFAAAGVRQTSFRLFSDGLLPIAFREDPRYYRLGHGSALRRARYALTRVFVGRTDAESNTPNYSAVLGRAFGAALTPAYYPAVSRNGKVVFQTFGTAIAGEMGLDFLREFFPGTRF